jgi:hypothetical protein
MDTHPIYLTTFSFLQDCLCFLTRLRKLELKLAGMGLVPCSKRVVILFSC